MADQPVQPQFLDDEVIPRPVRGARTATAIPVAPAVLPKERKLTFLATLDRPVLVIVGMLLALGTVMVFSATFNWSLVEFGSETAVLNNHLRNVAVGLVLMFVFARVDTRLIRRLAVIIMLMAISFLIAVLLFGDDTFGARRALINGRFQPGEFSELAIIIYMSAWLGSKNMRVSSLAYGLIPFSVLVLIVTGLVVLQPDLSTAAVIFMTSGMMFFLAGADLRQVGIIVLVIAIVGLTGYQFLPDYAKDRVDTFQAGLSDPTKTNYHTQQALIALYYGGWTGVGLGESEQKFLALPAPHTDSIFAVIGEELGVIGAGVVIALYIAFALRGFQIARRASDAFRALLAAGVTMWVSIKAILNIAVMTALVPSSGLPLPFISFGGSSLVVLMVGVGLLLSVQRDNLLQQPERRTAVAHYDRSRRNGGARVPRARRSRVDA
ncbi:MAG: putative lipid II flippase FtsW [Anaerolineae bacterium]